MPDKRAELVVKIVVSRDNLTVYQTIESILDQSPMSKMRKSSRAHKQIFNAETNHSRWFLTVVFLGTWLLLMIKITYLISASPRERDYFGD
jgi:hypothetical protein